VGICQLSNLKCESFAVINLIPTPLFGPIIAKDSTLGNTNVQYVSLYGRFLTKAR
jgi:hypothetical protein